MNKTTKYAGTQTEKNLMAFAEICWNVIRKPDGNPYEFAARLLVQASAHQSWSSWPCPSRCQLDP